MYNIINYQILEKISKALSREWVWLNTLVREITLIA